MPSVPEAIESYLTTRESELSDSSVQNHRYQLKQFHGWTRGEELDGVASLDPIDVMRFRRYRSNDLNSNTMYNQLSVLRLFLRFAHRMGWVGEELPESIVLPKRDGSARDRSIDPDRVAGLLDQLDTYQYASREHVILSLLWTAGLRIGALRALDARRDVHPRDRFIDLVDRPETGTPLKNGAGSEREVNLHGWVAQVIDDYLADRRIDTVCEYGREPLITSDSGRYSRTSVRRTVYSLTDCGGLTGSCDCSDRSSMCDRSVSPHDIRRSSISAWLDDGQSPDLLAQRFDVSTDTMDKHYDIRSESDKRELRRDAFDL
ncbi:tyrosine-type recombinase/integrase [Natrarchaeobius chitinivorans]|uniref:Site-specific integrase n=1 Tax=Natrarchaeobius chitinivorans TaxID=1679083 RepID=A0A3N6M200_NATCH|nr:site-specific integrase [Natrarchaeobius chitinivorans]RQG95777.1 site-specific integrase [Natrarchaeobius chitinivorans]